MVAPTLVSSRTRLLRRTVAALILTSTAWAIGGCSSDHSDSLMGEWEPTDVPSVDLPSDFDARSVSITFDDDGGWTASDGCNDLTGEYTLDDDGNFTSDAGSIAGVGLRFPPDCRGISYKE